MSTAGRTACKAAKRCWYKVGQSSCFPTYVPVQKAHLAIQVRPIKTKRAMNGASSSHHQSKSKSARKEQIHRTKPSIYQPLDIASKEIRVLKIQPLPNISWGILKCEMRHVSLTDDPKPQYDTISYCWGSPRAVSRIKVRILMGRTLLCG